MLLADLGVFDVTVKSVSSKKGESVITTTHRMIDDNGNTEHFQLLTRRLIEMIQDSAINTNGTQLLFTTHNALLLDLNFLRRDQIWFAEKNENSCATELCPLSSFSPRKGENIRKEYLQGRFGAIPFIGGEETWQR